MTLQAVTLATEAEGGLDKLDQPRVVSTSSTSEVPPVVPPVGLEPTLKGV